MKDKKAKKRIGLLNTEHLKESQPWTMGLVDLLTLLTWETARVLGISKTKYRKKIVELTMDCLKRRLPDKGIDFSEIEKKANAEVDRNIKQQIEDANPKKDDRYETPVTGLMVAPFEAQRRLRYFDKEYLNKEFNIFLSLLPDATLTRYFSQFFEVSNESKWSVFGNTNDIEQSTGIKYMLFDTLAYSHDTSTLVAVELKIDGKPSKDRVFKYAFLKADLESKGMIAKGSQFHLLFIGAKKESDEFFIELVQHGETLLSHGELPKKTTDPEHLKAIAPMVKKVLNQVQIKYTAWQEFGEHLEGLLADSPTETYAESYVKVIKGFLEALSLKWSKDQSRKLYERC